MLALRAIATKRVPSLLLIRSSTAFLPAFWAASSPALTSAGFDTVWPPISRITSPLWMPLAAAGLVRRDLGYDDALLAGARDLARRRELQAELRQAVVDPRR